MGGSRECGIRLGGEAQPAQVEGALEVGLRAILPTDDEAVAVPADPEGRLAAARQVTEPLAVLDGPEADAVPVVAADGR